MNKKNSVLALLFLALAISAQASEIVPTADFFRHSQYKGLKISPTGDYIAVVVPEANGEKLVILDRKTMALKTSFVFGEEHVIAYFEWANSERILVSPGRMSGSFDVPQPTGELFAGNADGSKKIQLLGPQMRGENQSYGFNINRIYRDESKYILVTKAEITHYPTTYKLNIYTDDLTRVVKSPVRNGSLIFDNSDVARVAIGGTKDAEQVVMYRDGVEDDWRTISATSIHAPTMMPIKIAPDGRHMWITSNEDAPTDGLYYVDLDSWKKQLLFRDPIADISNYYYDANSENIVGVEVESDYPRDEMFDQSHPESALRKVLAASFQDKHVTITSRTRDGSLVSLFVKSDRDPGTYYLFDTKNKKISPLLKPLPWIKPEQMASMEAIAVKARDGLVLRGYLTLPNGKDKNLPLIILPHGGPHGPRDSWSFDPEAQFFANRGYAVLQINFRGSGGYGREFEALGYQHWHTTMQDDLTDATMWAVKEGIADKDRLCIYGASYGGYASLMSPIREPDLYKCAVGYVGVYDMELMFGRGDIPARSEGQIFLEKVLGTDKASLRAMSPVHHLDKLKAALFLVHGEKDVRAHYQHFKDLRAALDKQNYPYQYLTKPKEAHGFYNEDNRVELYTKMLAFFDQHIGKNSGSVSVKVE